MGLLVGPRLGYQSHFLISSADVEITAALCEEVRRMHRAFDSVKERSCVAMYLSTGDVEAVRAAGVKALPVLLEPDAWIEVPEGGWDAWIESLPSKRRTSVRREVRDFEGAGLRIDHVGLDECWDRLPPIANSMAIKYDYSARTEDFIVEFGKYRDSTGSFGRVALCSRESDGALLGFCLYYVVGDRLFLRWASFDYDLVGAHGEYFNLTYYSQIRLAGELGVRWIHAGKKALQAKILRGAQLRPLWLLDLSERSPLVDVPAQIRAHNAKLLAEAEADSSTARAIADRRDWEVFC